MRPRVNEIREAGAELAAIGNGSVEHLRWFLDTEKPGFPAYTDPSLKVYGLAGLHRGLAATFSPSAGLRALGALSRGHRQAGVKGDPLQQGGVLLILPDPEGGSLAWRHVSRHSGDHPDASVIVDAVRRAVAKPDRGKGAAKGPAAKGAATKGAAAKKPGGGSSRAGRRPGGSSRKRR